MKKVVVLFIIIIGLVLVGCGEGEVNHNALEKYDVQNTTAEEVENDFTFRLVSEKKEYEYGEDVKLYGEITYTGEKDEIVINHSSSAILFSLKEEVRGYDIGFGVEDIGLSTTLEKGKPYREEYKKSGGYAEDDPKDYVTFMKNFLSDDHFPPGYYVVNGETDFAVENEGRVTIKATIDFKVLEK